MLKMTMLAGAAMALALTTVPSSAKELKSIGVSLGSMGNPFFVALSKGAEFEAKKANPNVKITTVGFEYDLGKQVTQIDNFIAAGVDLILLNPGDPKAIGPAMAVALLTTLYGAVLANMMALPIADKLHLRKSNEKLIHSMCIDGVLAIQAGQNPRVIESMLKAYLDPAARDKPANKGK